ncbi:MAG: adenylate kinase [Flavobacteriaceae bacterium]
MINLILFGKPGSGKGTQAEFVKKRYDLVHISTGDVFRYNILNKTDLGIEAKSFLDNGDLVPDIVTIKMLENEVLANKDANGFIFDGFPRTTTQAEILDDFLDSKNMSISMTIALDVDENLLIDRLINRGKESGRIDDQDRTKIQNRFDEYNNKTAPLINFYKTQNKFFKVDGVGDIDQISKRIFSTIEKNT